DRGLRPRRGLLVDAHRRAPRLGEDAAGLQAQARHHREGIALMGGSTQQRNTNQQTQTQPWAPATPLLQGLLGNLGAISPSLTSTETGALNTLSANAQAGNPYAGRIGDVASGLLAGGGPDRTGLINNAYQQYQQSLTPFARGDYVNPASNPAL